VGVGVGVGVGLLIKFMSYFKKYTIKLRHKCNSNITLFATTCIYILHDSHNLNHKAYSSETSDV